MKESVPEGAWVRVHGRVSRSASVWVTDTGAQRTECWIYPDALSDGRQWYGASGLLRVCVKREARPIPAGERIWAEGSFSYPVYPRGPDRAWGLLNVPAGNFIRGEQIPERDNLQARIHEQLSLALPHAHSQLVAALILGERKGLGSWARSFRVLGAGHLLAISGLHVVLVLGLVRGFFALLPLPWRWPWVIGVFGVLAYTGLAGAPVSAVRAGICLTLGVLAHQGEREVSAWNLWACCVLVFLWSDPYWVTSVGFQLSFGAVAAILAFSRGLDRILTRMHHGLRLSFGGRVPPAPVGPGYRTVQGAVSVTAVSAAAWLGLMPLLAYYFALWSPISILATLLMLPVFTGVLALALLWTLPMVFGWDLSWFFAGVLEPLISLLFAMAHRLSRIPGAYWELPPISLWEVMGYYGALIFVVWALAGRKAWKRMLLCAALIFLGTVTLDYGLNLPNSRVKARGRFVRLGASERWNGVQAWVGWKPVQGSMVELSGSLHYDPISLARDLRAIQAETVVGIPVQLEDVRGLP